MFSTSSEGLGIHITYHGEHLLWKGIAEATFVSPGYWGAESRENDNIVRVFLKDAFQSFLDMSHGQGATL